MVEIVSKEKFSQDAFKRLMEVFGNRYSREEIEKELEEWPELIEGAYKEYVDFANGEGYIEIVRTPYEHGIETVISNMSMEL